MSADLDMEAAVYALSVCGDEVTPENGAKYVAVKNAFIVAAALREKEIEELKARNTELHIQNRMMYLQNFGTVEAGQEKEIATLLARVGELEGMVPRWVRAKDVFSQENVGRLSVLTNCDKDGTLYLMVPPIPAPAPETKP